MKTKIKLFLSIFVFFTTLSFNIKGQIAISNYSEIAKIKNGTTYIALNSLSSGNLDIIKKNWTISKIVFIRHTEVEKYLSPENSFLTVGGIETTSTFTKTTSSGTQYKGSSYTNTHRYLELWTCNEKYFKNKEKYNNSEFGSRDKIQVARIELYTDLSVSSNPDEIFESDFNGKGHVRNWGSGIMKNYIQSLMIFLNKNENHSLYSNITNVDELKNLKDQVLYIPDYILKKFNKFSGYETKSHNESKLFKKYKYKYDVISSKELNKKIIEDKTGFYYLLYVKSSTEKYITVINSLTGEMVYSTYSPMSYNVKSDDFDRLYKKIE